MSGVLERAAEFFLAPSAAEPRAEHAVVPPAVRAVVLGTPTDAVPLAAAVALSLRTAGRARAAAVAVWSPEHAETAAIDDEAGHESPAPELRRGAASRSARALAARLAGRRQPAAARGRVAWLVLPDEAPAAAAAVRHASSIVDGPLVTALTGPRPAELDDLVAEHDLAFVAADPETPLARAALAALTARGVAASARVPLRRGVPRALALAGLTGPRVDVPRLAVARFEEER